MKKYPETINGCKVTYYEKCVYINQAHSLIKGSFRKWYVDELIPFCNENDIEFIFLSDAQYKGKENDMWSRYGFSGRYRSGNRYNYIRYEGNKIMNDLSEIALSFIIGEFDKEEFKENVTRYKATDEAKDIAYEYAREVLYEIRDQNKYGDILYISNKY